MKTLLKRARIVLLLTILAFLLCSCKTRYIPVETVRIDTTYISKIQYDSAHTNDSVFIFVKGDTVVKYKYKYIYKFKEIHDTLWRERVDTIHVPYPVEAQLTKWQKIKMDLSSIAVNILAVLVLIAVCKIVIRWKL